MFSKEFFTKLKTLSPELFQKLEIEESDKVMLSVERMYEFAYDMKLLDKHATFTNEYLSKQTHIMTLDDRGYYIMDFGKLYKFLESNQEKISFWLL